MSQTLTLELDDEIYAAIERHARSRGTSAASWLASALRRSGGLLERIQASESSLENEDQRIARERFESHFGKVDLGHPTGSENDAIDADLAKAYADSHQGS